MWLARDKDGELYLYDAYPKKRSEFFGSQFGYSSMLLDVKLYPEVTWENSPRKIEFTFSATGTDRGRRDSIVRGLKQLEKDYMLSYEKEIKWLNQLVKDDADSKG